MSRKKALFQPNDNKNQKIYVIWKKNLIGTAHGSSFAALEEIGSVTKPSFWILHHSAHISPFLQCLLRGVLGLDCAESTIYIAFHASQSLTSKLDNVIEKTQNQTINNVRERKIWCTTTTITERKKRSLS